MLVCIGQPVRLASSEEHLLDGIVAVEEAFEDVPRPFLVEEPEDVPGERVLPTGRGKVSPAVLMVLAPGFLDADGVVLIDEQILSEVSWGGMFSFPVIHDVLRQLSLTPADKGLPGPTHLGIFALV